MRKTGLRRFSSTFRRFPTKTLNRSIRSGEPLQSKSLIRLDWRTGIQQTGIGIAVTTDAHSDADELLRHADVAMYAAKAAGKNRYEVFEASMHGEIVERMRLETDLREAVLRGLVRVEYQPVVDLDTTRIVGFEALARSRQLS